MAKFYSIPEKEREELILKYMPLVKSIALRIKRQLPPSVDLQDLIGYGIVGLINAIDRMDKTKNPESYIKIRIRGAIYDYLRSLDFGSRRVREKEKKIKKALEELSKELGREPTDEEISQRLGENVDSFYHDLHSISFSYILSLEDIFKQDEGRSYEEIVNSDAPSIEESVISKEMEEKVKKAVEKLDEKEKMVLQLIFYEELPLKDVAQILGCSISRVSQIKARALEKMKKYIRED